FARSYPIEVVPLPTSVRDSVLQATAERLRQFVPELIDDLRGAVAEITIYPPLQEMIIGRDGTVWIALANREGSRPYLVLAADGEPLGTIELSARSRIAEAEEGRIWVI